ncbi:hypothetical protein ABBQ32_011070 [Trebouxia sp. C0010 RCD-2024]
MEQYGNLATHFTGLHHMMDSLEYRWAKADQKLFLYHKRFFGPLEAADRQKLYSDTARYLAGKGIFSTALPNFTDPKDNPEEFWDLVQQSAPELAWLAVHMFQMPVNSAAVEILCLWQRPEQAQKPVCARQGSEDCPALKSMLPPKARSEKQQTGKEYLSASVTRASAVRQETAAAETMEAGALTQHEYIEGPEDLLVEPEQVDSLVEMYSKQLREDAADDDEYLNTPVAELGEEDEENDAPPTERPKRCKLADLFVGMPLFDLEMLFEDDFTVN